MIDYEYAILDMQESEVDDCARCDCLEGCKEGIYDIPPCEIITPVIPRIFREE